MYLILRLRNHFVYKKKKKKKKKVFYPQNIDLFCNHYTLFSDYLLWLIFNISKNGRKCYHKARSYVFFFSLFSKAPLLDVSFNVDDKS